MAARTAELRESEQQYRQLVVKIQNGYLVLSKKRIEYVNLDFCKLHGLTLDQATQQSFLFFVAGENRDRVKQIGTGHALDGIELETFEYLRKIRDGACLPTKKSLADKYFLH